MVEVDDDVVLLGDLTGPSALIVVECGSSSSVARPVGAGLVYWKLDFGIDPTNAEDGDLIYNRPA